MLCNNPYPVSAGIFGNKQGIVRCYSCNCYCAALPDSNFINYQCCKCGKIYCYDCGEEKGFKCCKKDLMIYREDEVK